MSSSATRYQPCGSYGPLLSRSEAEWLKSRMSELDPSGSVRGWGRQLPQPTRRRRKLKICETDDPAFCLPDPGGKKTPGACALGGPDSTEKNGPDPMLTRVLAGLPFLGSKRMQAQAASAP